MSKRIARLKSDLTCMMSQRVEKKCVAKLGSRNGYRCFSGIICVLCRQFLAPRPVLGVGFHVFSPKTTPRSIVALDTFFSKARNPARGMNSSTSTFIGIVKQVGHCRYTLGINNKLDLMPLQAKFNTNSGKRSFSIHLRSFFKQFIISFDNLHLQFKNANWDNV